jgi:lysophospholipase L1-like esterase
MATLRPYINIVCAGNSLVAGTGSTGSFDYPSQLKNFFRSGYKITNSGVGGQNFNAMQANYTTQVGQYYDSSAHQNIVIGLEHTNQLMGSTVSNSINEMNNWIQLCQTTGYKVIIATMLPRHWYPYKGNTTVSGYNQLNADRLSLNELIIANASTYNYTVADIGGDSRIGVFHQNEQSGYTYSETPPTNSADGKYVDGTHLSNLGYGVITSIIVNSVYKIIK